MFEPVRSRTLSSTFGPSPRGPLLSCRFWLSLLVTSSVALAAGAEPSTSQRNDNSGSNEATAGAGESTAPDKRLQADEDDPPPPKLPPLEVHIDKQRVDLERRQLELRMSRPAGRVELKVYGESGMLLAEVEQSFDGKPAKAPLLVRWSTNSDEPVARIEVFAFDKYDYFKGLALVPWSFSVPHEEVVFETNSAEIRPSEEPKLQASLEVIERALQKHEDLGKISLFVAGHTDTQGEPRHNLQLSRQRARAIAVWFRKQGLTLPIAYEGFGETSLKVKTADEVDEPQNRRVDYVLSVEIPRFKSTGGTPSWKKI